MTNFFGFIPYNLELNGFPEYDNFPYNILYVSYANIGGVDMTGRAVYYPDFSTFREDEGTQCMTYFNQHSRDWKVIITYDKEQGSWEGWKYHHDELRGGAVGTKWDMFFAHLTGGGLAPGERVEYEKLESGADTESVE